MLLKLLGRVRPPAEVLALVPSVPGTPAPATEPSWKRKSERRQDRVLAPATLAWAEQLPAELRPTQTLERYPWVANRLALGWDDAALTGRVFDDLLIDRRGGRKGYSRAVGAELVRLRHFRCHVD